MTSIRQGWDRRGQPDPEGIDVQPFINKSQLDFVSFRSESSPSREISNQIAHDFGMVSLPFVAILDETGVIRSLNFRGEPRYSGNESDNAINAIFCRQLSAPEYNEVQTAPFTVSNMKTQFIELTGKTLLDVVNEGEIDFKQLHDAGVVGDSILRINPHGEIELRCKSKWMLVGGLIGSFEERLTELTGLDWA